MDLHSCISFPAAIKCPRLRRPNYGEVYPPECATRRSRHGRRCAFACRLPGFELHGAPVRECVAPGVWSGGGTGSDGAARCVGEFPVVEIT